MALNKFDKANLNRLRACVKPNQTKIDKLKTKLKKTTEAIVEEINFLEHQNAEFNVLIMDLESRDTLSEEVPQEINGTATEVIVSEEPLEEAEEDDDEECDDLDPFNDEQLNSTTY